MAAKTLTLARWEWFKLRRRWMPWILLAIALLFSQLAVWGPFIAYLQERGNDNMVVGFAGGPRDEGGGRQITVDCRALLAGDTSVLPTGTPPEAVAGYEAQCRLYLASREQALEQAKQAFTLPRSIAQALGVAQGFGIILIAIMTASAIGSEYGWGTLRTVLVRGTGRRAYLLSKLGIIAAGGLLLMVLAATLAILSSLITGGLAGASQDIGGASFAGDFILDIGRAWFALWPFIGLAALISVAAKSSAAGMAGAIGYYFGEIITTAIFSGLFDWFSDVEDYFMAASISAWMQGLRLGGGTGNIGIGARFGEYPSELHAFLVLSAYIAVMAAAAFWLFQRRDVTAGGGG